MLRQDITQKNGKEKQQCKHLLCSDMASVEEQQQQQLSDELADIDLNDPELAQAASKIQKQFRGFKKASGDSKKAAPPPVEVLQDEEENPKKETSQEDDVSDGLVIWRFQLRVRVFKKKALFENFYCCSS